MSRELRVFYELARVVAAGPYEVAEILERICSEIREAFGFERAILATYNAAEHGVQGVVQHGVDWPGDEWLPLSWFPFLERALETRSAVYVRDAPAEGAVPEEIAERFGVRSLVGVPLVTEGRIIGFLVGDRHGEDFELTERELELLSAIASVAAVFVEKADQYEQLQRALEDLERLDALKSDFISIASHELRTPISVVHGVAATLHLRGAELEDEQLRSLRAVLYEHTTRLSELTDQLLDLSRIDAGALRVKPEAFGVRERCESLFRRLAPDRLGEIDVAIDPTLEVTTDPDAFERVVANLIMNALKYGLAPITVSARRVRKGKLVELVVEDRGAGVDPGFVANLFERFTRSERDRSGPRGAGLGLAIAHSYATAIGGELRYEQADPSGARFVLTIPG